MSINHRLILYLIISMSIAILFGCSNVEHTPSPEQVDKSPFTGIPCAAPCWHGLTIGKSSEADVMETLRTLTFINQDTMQIYRGGTMPGLNPAVYGQGVEINANCLSSEKQCLKLQIVDGLLTEVEIMPNYGIRINEAIEYLGDPDYIGYGMLGAERIICEIYFVWSDKQLILASEKFEGFRAVENNCGLVRDTKKVASSLLISRVRYKSIKAIEFMLSRDYNQTFEFSGTIPGK